MPRTSGSSPLAVPLPHGGGDVRGLGGTFVPDYNRGTGSYQIPLRLPRGAGGFTPELVLAYSSGAPNGAFGLGWSIAVTKVQRRGDRGFVRYDADRFLLDGSGPLVRLGDGSYRPAVDERFARITRTASSAWEIRERDGMTRRLGTTAAARIADPADPARVLAWLLEAEEDRNGNRVDYRYRRDASNLYLEEIAYAVYRIVFGYEQRPDPYGTARHGFRVETRLRCTSIEIHCDRLPAGSTLIRRYALSYTEPAETPLSLLRRLEHTGHRDGETAALPPLTFDYSAFRPERRRYRALETVAGAPPPPPGPENVDLVDLTGDGLPDVVQLDGVRNRIWRNRGDGTWDPPRDLDSVPATATLGSTGVALADMEGNGSADLVVTDGPRAGYFPNEGRGGWGPFRRFARRPDGALVDPRTRLVDLDADGRVDLLRSTSDALLVCLNRGVDGWATPIRVPRVRDRERFPDVSLADARVHLADLTGDGLADIVLVRSGAVWSWPYEGLARWGARRTMGSPPVLPRQADPRRVVLTDVNGDGLADCVYVDVDRVFVWVNRAGAGFSKPIVMRGTPLTGGAQVRSVDLLGSGTAGILWSFEPATTSRRNYKYLDVCGDEKPYLLTGVDNGLGRRVKIEYSTSARFAAADRRSGRPWRGSLPIAVQVVARTRIVDPVAGADVVTDIRYHDGLYDGRERRFAGFGEVEIEERGDARAPTLVTTVRFDGTPLDGLAPTPAAVAAARWGKVLETVQRDGARPDVLRRVVNRWEATVAVPGDDPVVAVHKRQSRTEVNGGPDGPLVVEHEYGFDDGGRVTSERHTANGPAPLTKLTRIEYATRPDGERIATPSRVVETTADGTVTREMRTFYDGAPFAGLPLGQATRGNPTRVAMRVLGTAAFDAHYGPAGLTAAALGYRVEDGAVWSDASRSAFDGKGNVVTARSPLGADSRLEYDAGGVFCIRVRDALGLETRFEWDERALQPSVMTDPAAAVTRFAYDPLGRLTKLARPGDGVADPTETVSYHLDASPPFAELTKRLTASGGPRAVRRIFYDGGGREVQTRMSTGPGAVAVSAPVKRDARGRLGEKGVASAASGLEFAPVAMTTATTYEYDALGHPVAITPPVGRAVRKRHDAFRTLVSDANGTETVFRLDGWGRTVGTAEHHDGVITAHAYDYDSEDRLTAIRGPGAALIATHRYDLLGNVLRIEHRDAGTRSFFYDAAARVVRGRDAAGATIERQYDAGDRPLRTLVDGQQKHAFGYDAAGRASTIEDDAGRWEIEHDARGRMTARTLRSGGRSWRVGQRYSPADLVEAVEYPDGVVVRYEHDLAGRVVRVPGYVDEIGYDPRGRRRSVRFANGVRTLVDYDEATAFLTRLRHLRPDGTPLEDVAYQRDPVGNVLALLDARPAPHSRRFAYDGRYRLVRVDGGAAGGAVAPYRLEFAYDESTNVTRIGGSSLTYDPPGSNLLAGLASGGAAQPVFAHDANGNLTRMPGRTLDYDAFGRLARVRRSGGGEVGYRYNAAGQRVWRASGARRTVFISDVFEEDEDGAVRRLVTDKCVSVAFETAGQRTFLHPNDLGHITLATDAAGGVARRVVFDPFGLPHGGTGPLTPTGAPGFRSGSVDELTGLVLMGARHYAPEIGRFTSPDPLLLTQPGAGIAIPQLHNLYAYAVNNPMVYADPSGLSLEGAIAGGLIGGIVGAVVLVVSGGNPILAGLAGGFAGGAVSGAIDGGAKGAVIGGLMGAALGGLGGAVMWGASAIGFAIAQESGRNILSAIAATALTMPSYVQGIVAAEAGNWELLAALGVGIVGGIAGRALTNAVIMRGAYHDLNNSPRVRQIEREVQAQTGNQVDFKHVTYRVGTTQEAQSATALGFERNHTVSLVRENIGDDYLQFRETIAHELQHDIQEHTVADFDKKYAAISPDLYFTNGNPYEAQARFTGARYMNWVPNPIIVAAVGQPGTASLATYGPLRDELFS